MNNEERAAARVAFDLAARLVQCEPDAAWIGECVQSSLFSDAPFGEDDDAVQRGLSLLSSWCDTAGGCEEEATQDIARDWLRLFAGCGAPEAPIVESFYTEPNSTLFGRATIEVKREYERWGLSFEKSGKEPDDSLGLMLAFCAHLMREQVRAVRERAKPRLRSRHFSRGTCFPGLRRGASSLASMRKPIITGALESLSLGLSARWVQSSELALMRRTVRSRIE